MVRYSPVSTGPRSGAGAVWLISGCALLILAAVVFLLPDIPRRLFGSPSLPSDRGSEPAPNIAIKTTSDHVTTTKPGPAQPVATTTDTAPKPVAPVQPKVETKIYRGDVTASSSLTEARAAYRKYQWTKASLAAKAALVTMDISPATRQRAQDLIHGSNVLEKLFSTLNDADELTRGYDTHPCLVEVVTHGSPSYAVPVESAENPVPVEKNPLAVIERQKQLGTVHLFYKGRKEYFLTSLDANVLESAKAVDLKPIMEQKKTDLTARLNGLKSGPEQHSPLAWYEAARFAYRNRLDEQVTDLMDRALELDPSLLATVREDRAATLLGTMLVHLRNGNKPQAATYLATINKRFSDTDSGKQAQAYYAGETAKLLAMVKDAEARQRAADAKRKADRLARASALGDEQAAAKINQETPVNDTPEEPGKPVSGDELTADKLMEEGRKLCGEAMNAGIGPDRNRLYKQAAISLRKAKSLFSDLASKQPNNQTLQQKMMEVGRILYLAVKGLSAG